MDITEYSRDDLKQVDTYLQGTIFIPDEFKTWLTDQWSLRAPALPVEHFLGYVKVRGYSDVVITDETTVSATFDDLATEGPILEEVPNGKYVLLYGVTMWAVGGVTPPYNGEVLPSINDTTMDSIYSIQGYIPGGNSFNYPASRATVVTLDSVSQTNTIKLLYRRFSSEGTIHFRYRWIAAIRVS